MKVLFVDVIVDEETNHILHISYIFYNFGQYKTLLTQSFDINLYHRAHEIFNGNHNYVVQNNQLNRILAILFYYIRLADVIVALNYEFLLKVLQEEAIRTNISMDINTTSYCISSVYKKIFRMPDDRLDDTDQLLYIIYQELFAISYMYCSQSTLLNCILMLRIYYKFTDGNDIEKIDLNVKHMRIHNS